MSKEDKLDYTSTFTMDTSGFDVGDTITITNTSDSDCVYTIADMNTTSFTIRDLYQDHLDEIDAKVEKILERLSILEDPDPVQLEKNRALKKAYEHYKFVEALAGAKNGKAE